MAKRKDSKAKPTKAPRAGKAAKPEPDTPPAADKPQIDASAAPGPTEPNLLDLPSGPCTTRTVELLVEVISRLADEIEAEGFTEKTFASIVDLRGIMGDLWFSRMQDEWDGMADWDDAAAPWLSRLDRCLEDERDPKRMAAELRVLAYDGKDLLEEPEAEREIVAEDERLRNLLSRWPKKEPAAPIASSTQERRTERRDEPELPATEAAGGGEELDDDGRLVAEWEAWRAALKKSKPSKRAKRAEFVRQYNHQRPDKPITKDAVRTACDNVKKRNARKNKPLPRDK